MASPAPAMAAPASPASPDVEVTRESLEQQPFVDHLWLCYNGPLRRENVLEYFCLSRFFDRQSNNEELRMQGIKDIRLEHVVGMKGVQYLAEEVPGPTPEAPVFVVKKLLRQSQAQEPQVLDVYYVLNGMIYQAPTIFSVLNARLRRCASLLNKAQKTLHKAVGFQYHQPGMGAGAGGSSDLYRLQRKETKPMQTSRKRAAPAAASSSAEPVPMEFTSSYGEGASAMEQYYPPLRGEDMRMVDVPPASPTASAAAAAAAHQANGEAAAAEPEGIPARLISRYPGPSPLAEMMQQSHPEASAAVDRAMKNVETWREQQSPRKEVAATGPQEQI